MKSFLRSLVLLALATATFSMAFSFYAEQASAAEIDTHFYDQYDWARRAGFTHEYARFFATMNQWVDVGASSTPMGPLFIGTLLRRGWHFPNRRFQPTSFTQDGHASIALMAIAEPDNPQAFKLFNQGLQEGNYYKLGLALHIAVDSWMHAGFADLDGHWDRGHNPDRTWLAPEKYREMTYTLFQMMIAIRQVVPDEALEPWAQELRKKPLDPREYEKLADENWAEVGDLISLNYFKDPRFTPPVVNYILRLAKVKGYIAATYDIDSHLPKAEDYLFSAAEIAANSKLSLKEQLAKYGGGQDKYSYTRKDARQVLREWVVARRTEEMKKGILVTGSMFDMKVLDFRGFRGVRERLLQIENQTTDVAERIAAHDRLISPRLQARIIEQTIDLITQGEIPKDFDDYTKVQFESDDGPRALEMALKIGDRRAHIMKKWGVNIEFIADTMTNRAEEKAKQAKVDKVQAQDPSLNLILTAPVPEILNTRVREIVSLNKAQQAAVIVVKNGYNLGNFTADLRDSRTKGKYTMNLLANVAEFQIVDMLTSNIESGSYKQLGTLSQMKALGVSLAEESCPAIVDVKQAKAAKPLHSREDIH